MMAVRDRKFQFALRGVAVAVIGTLVSIVATYLRMNLLFRLGGVTFIVGWLIAAYAIFIKRPYD
jgi:hypothetical protein